jgi:hypothetical protein
MMRSHVRVALALVLVGCRPPAPPVAETAPDRSPQPGPVLTQPEAQVKPEAPELVAIDRAATTDGVPPPGVGAPESACEQSCGEVHDCALVDGSYAPTAAAAIELRCVGACLSTPERATLFGCRRPTVIEPGACSPFLACVSAAWPTGNTESPTEIVVDHGGGCARACDAFARCWDPSTTPDRIAQCVEQCQQALDDAGERRIGTCSELPECADIMTCVAETPGA